MTQHVESYAEAVVRILERVPSDVNDFASLAIAGEQLRRVLALEGDAAAAHAATLDQYDQFLASYEGAVPAILHQDAQGVVTELASYAATNLHERNRDVGEHLLAELDEVLSIGAAMARANRLDAAELQRLQQLATPAARELAPKLHDLCQVAEDQMLVFGDDPTYPQLYGFWEELAELAPSRVRLEESVAAEARRERLLGLARDHFEARVEKEKAALQGETEGWFDRIAAKLKDFLAAPIAVHRPALQRFADDMSTPGDEQILIDTDELTLQRSGKVLIAVVQEGHELDATSEDSDQATVPVSRLDARTAEITIPPNARSLRLALVIDGQPLPVIEVPISDE